MKTIQVSDEMYNFLMELSKEINTQDNRATAKPYFFQIQTNEQISVPEGCGTEAWHYDGSTIETKDEIINTIFEYKDESLTKDEIMKLDEWEKEQILEDDGWAKCNYDYKHEYQNAFLTEKACKEHIRLNHYNYNEPVDYLSHASRNPELEKIFRFISELSEKSAIN